MTKIKVQITLKETRKTEIMNIDIKNGCWKVWEDHFEEKQSLTINNIYKSNYLGLPVKDAYGFFNVEEENINEAIIRTYDSLLEYLNLRINNSKQWNKFTGDNEFNYTCVLFDEDLTKNTDVVENIEFVNNGLLEIKVTIL